MFKNRTEAGRKLAEFFDHINGKNAVVYALPRGGVVIGAEIAKTIHAPLDLIITRKIGHPSQPEYAIGALAENGHSVFNKEEGLNINEHYLTTETEKQRKEAGRRRKAYLSERKPILCAGKTAILVDDGIATGLTVKAAVKELRLHYSPKKIIVAVPVAPKDTVNELEQEGIEVLAILTTKDFLGAIGAYYQDFAAVEDEDVIRMIKETERYSHISKTREYA
ncbi:MAG: phosphoribosyltransferase family protein [Candidatus Daviesbacteria bacterium]|nr:phosphoribosyltransferase family protein [Candidatus Daviesbacteria bacterium]